MRGLYFTLPGGGFLSLILAIFIRGWAIDHGHTFLAKLATIYIFILLIPFIITVLALIIIGPVFLFFIIFAKKRKKESKAPSGEIIDAQWKES